MSYKLVHWCIWVEINRTRRRRQSPDPKNQFLTVYSPSNFFKFRYPSPRSGRTTNISSATSGRCALRKRSPMNRPQGETHILRFRTLWRPLYSKTVFFSVFIFPEGVSWGGWKPELADSGSMSKTQLCGRSIPNRSIPLTQKLVVCCLHCLLVIWRYCSLNTCSEVFSLILRSVSSLHIAQFPSCVVDMLFHVFYILSFVQKEYLNTLHHDCNGIM